MNSVAINLWLDCLLKFLKIKFPILSMFYKHKAEVTFSVEASYKSDIYPSVFATLQSKLLRYMPHFEGIPLFFNIHGIMDLAEVLPDGSLLITTLIDFYVLKPHGCIEIVDGKYLGIFDCVVDRKKDYTGVFHIESIKAPCTIVGTTDSNEF